MDAPRHRFSYKSLSMRENIWQKFHSKLEKSFKLLLYILIILIEYLYFENLIVGLDILLYLSCLQTFKKIKDQ